MKGEKMKQKYKILYNKKKYRCGNTLYQIMALRDIFSPNGEKIVSEGDLGGYIGDPYNLSQEGSCWIFPDAVVLNFATVSENALIMEHSFVSDHAFVKGNAKVAGTAKVEGAAIIKDNAIIHNSAFVSGTSTICGNAQILANAKILGSAYVSENAIVKGFAEIKGNAKIMDSAIVSGNASIKNSAIVRGHATVSGESIVKDNAIVEDNANVCANSIISGKAIIKGLACIKGAIVSDSAIVGGTVVVKGHSEIKGNSNLTGRLHIYKGSTINISDPKFLLGTSPFSVGSYKCSFNSTAPIKITDENYKDYMIVPVKKFGCITFSGKGERINLFIMEHIERCLGFPFQRSFKEKSDLLKYLFQLFPTELISDISDEVKNLEEIFCDFLSCPYEVIDNAIKELSCNFIDRVLSLSVAKELKDLIQKNSDEICRKAENFFFGVFVELIIAFLFEESIPHSINTTFLSKLLEDSIIDIHSCAISSFSNSLFNYELIRMVAKVCDLSDSWGKILFSEMRKTNFLMLEPFLKKNGSV